MLAALVERAESGRHRTVLRRWQAETGAALPEVTLADQRPVARLASADDRHLVLTSALRAGAATSQRYLWSIHSLSTGERLAELEESRSAMPFCVLGNRLLVLSPASGPRVAGAWVEQPPGLRAVDLETGAEVWRRPVRETAYRGPRPPAS